MPILEALPADLHIAAFPTIVVSLASLAALCCLQWLNAVVVRRLAHDSHCPSGLIEDRTPKADHPRG